MRDLAFAKLDSAIETLGWHGAHVHEGIHQGRKSLREARALMALGGSALGASEALIDRELQGLNRDLSSWRDGQAIVDAIDRLKKREASAKRIVVLQRAHEAAMRARVELGHAALAEDSPFAATRALLRTLQVALPSLDWLSVTRQTINHALAYSRRRIEKAIARARSDGKTIDWHRLRKRVRRLIQQYAALDELHIDGVTHPFEIVKERERKLAKQLGRAQDCVLLLERCRKPSIFGGDRKIVSTLAHAKLERSRRKAARLIAGHATCADW